MNTAGSGPVPPPERAISRRRAQYPIPVAVDANELHDRRYCYLLTALLERRLGQRAHALLREDGRCFDSLFLHAGLQLQELRVSPRH